MLGWVSLRSKALVSHVVHGKLANVHSSTLGPSAAVSRTSRTISRRIVSQQLCTLNSGRYYAKVAKVVKKTPVGKEGTSSPALIYDEDYEDLDSVDPGDYGITSAYTDSKPDPSFLKSSSQIEQILRESMPPELVDQAIAEHRRVYSAHKAGKLSKADALRTGFTKRLDPSEIQSASTSAASSPSSPASPASSASTKALTSQSTGKSSSASKSKTKKTVSSKKSKTAAKPSGATSSSKSRADPDMEDQDDDAESLYKEYEEHDDEEDDGSRIARGARDVMREMEKEREEMKKDMQLYGIERAGRMMEHRRERMEALMRRQEALENDPDEDYLHRRMERLKGILSEKLVGEDGENALTEEDLAVFERRPPKPFALRSEPTSALAIRARDHVAKGRWNEAFEIYHQIARNDHTAQVLSTFAGEAFANKQYEVAGKAAIEAYNINEHDVRANRIAAKVHLELFDENAKDAQKRLALAHQHIDRALEQNPDWPDLLATKATIYMISKQYKIACAYFKAALIEADRLHLDRPSRLPIYRDYAKSLAGRGKYKLALSYLTIAHQIAQDDLEIISLLAELHERGFGDFQTAAQYYKLAVQVNPDDVPSLVRLAQILADPTYPEQNLPQARQCYERAMMLQPLPEFWFPLGWLSMSIGETDKALTCLQKAAELDPQAQNRWTSIVLLAELYSFDEDPATQVKSLKKAIQLYKFAMEEKPDSQIKFNLAKCYLRAGNTHEAEALLEIIKLENPNNPELRCALVEAYQMAGRTQDAVRELGEIIASHPDAPMPHFMKGSYLCEIADYKAAIPYLERCVTTTRMDPDAMINTPQFAEALTQLESQLKESMPKEFAALKKKAKADKGTLDDIDASKTAAGVLNKRMASQTILNDQDKEQTDFLPDAYRLLSRCYFEAENWEGAKKSIAFSLAYEPENTELLVALSEIQLKLGEEDDAIDTLRKASVVDRTALRPNFQLGNLFAQRGQHDQAITYYQKALGVWESIANARESGAAYESSESLSEEELVGIIYNIHTSLAMCYAELGKYDKSNAARYAKAAKQCLLRAQEIKESIEQ